MTRALTTESYLDLLLWRTPKHRLAGLDNILHVDTLGPDHSFRYFEALIAWRLYLKLTCLLDLALWVLKVRLLQLRALRAKELLRGRLLAH